MNLADSPSPSPEPGRIVRKTGVNTGWNRWLPGFRTLREYQIAWLRHDILAGLVLTTMLVPVGIAYAVASGLPGIYGLYATIVPLIAYALFGPSRILVLGPDSSLAAVILAVILPLSGGDPQRALELGVLGARLLDRHQRRQIPADGGDHLSRPSGRDLFHRSGRAH